MKYTHYAFATILAILTSCSIPKLGGQNDKPTVLKEVVNEPRFTVKSVLDTSLENIPYGPDKYSGLRVLSNTGSPVRVTSERSIPKNFPISFKNVAITPVDYQEKIYTIPSEQNLAQFQKIFLKTTEMALQNYQRTFWENFIKALQEQEQKLEDEDNRRLYQFQEGSPEYQEAKQQKIENRQAMNRTFSVFKVLVKQKLQEEVDLALAQVKQKYSDENYMIKGDCYRAENLGEFFQCSADVTFLDYLAWARQDTFKEDYLRAYEKQHGIKINPDSVSSDYLSQKDPSFAAAWQSIYFANEVTKKEKWGEAYTSALLELEFIYNPHLLPAATLEDLQHAQAPNAQVHNFGFEEANKPIPEQKTEKVVETLEPTVFENALADTISFIAKYADDTNQGGFIAPIFLSDILSGLHINGVNWTLPEACNLQNSYLTGHNFSQILQPSNDNTYTSSCDIAIDVALTSHSSALKYVADKYKLDVELLRRAVASAEDQLLLGQNTLFGHDPQLQAATNYYQNTILPMLAKDISANRVNEDGSLTLSSQLGMPSQELVDNVLGVINFKPQFEQGFQPKSAETWTIDWLMWLIHNYQERGLISDNVDLTSIEMQLTNLLFGKALVVEITTPKRCDYQEKTQLTADIESGKVPNLGTITFTGSSENFAIDGDYSIKLLLKTPNITQDDAETLVSLDNIPLTNLLGISTSNLFGTNDQQHNVPLSLISPDFQYDSSLLDEQSNTVSLGITNRSGNTWDISVDKLGYETNRKTYLLNCDAAYRAVCLPYNKSIFTLKHTNYRTGLYRLSASYSKTRLTESQRNTVKATKAPWWEVGADWSTGRVYGRNRTKYGPRFAYDFLLLNPQYSTFARSASAPRDFDFITRYSLDAATGTNPGYANGFEVFYNRDFSNTGVEETQQPHDDINPLVDTPGLGEEVNEEPKAKIGVHEAYQLDRKHREQNKTGLQVLPTPLSNALIDLAVPQAQISTNDGYVNHGSYGIFHRPLVARSNARKFVHVGAVVNLSNNYPDIRASLFSMSKQGSAFVPMRLVLSKNNVVLKKWGFDARIGTNTFVQRYWDGTTNTKRNFTNPNYDVNAEYRVTVELDYEAWNQEYRNFLSQAYFQANIYNPNMLHGSSDRAVFQIADSADVDLKINKVELRDSDIFIYGEAAGLSAEQMRQLQPDFGEDLTVKEGGYEVILGSQSNYLIRVRDYEVDPAFFADYPYDRAPETTDPQTLMQARVIFDASGLKTQSIGEDVSQFFSNIFNFAADQLDEFDEYNKERRAKNLERIGKMTQPSDTLVIPPTAGLSAPSLALGLDEYMVGKHEALNLLIKYHDWTMEYGARRFSGYSKEQWAALPLFARNGLVSSFQELSYAILPESVIDVMPLGKTTKIAKQTIPELKTTINLFEAGAAKILKSDAYKAATKLEKEKADKMVQLMHQIADELREHIEDINNNCGSGCDASVRFYYELFRDSYISLGDYLLYKPLQDHRKFLTTYFDLKDLDVYFSKDNVPDFSVLHRIVNGQRVRLSGDDLKHYMKKEVEITLSTVDANSARRHDMSTALDELLKDSNFVSELKNQYPNTVINKDFLEDYFRGYDGHHGPFTSSDRTRIKFQFVKRELHQPFRHKGTVHK